MTFQQLLKAYEFGELFPEIVTMLPQARTMRKRFEQAYDELSTLRPVASKKVIRYELMHDPDSKEDFVGADDECFRATWDVLAGKEVKKGPHADLTDLEMTANCLLNAVLQGSSPHSRQ